MLILASSWLLASAQLPINVPIPEPRPDVTQKSDDGKSDKPSVEDDGELDGNREPKTPRAETYVPPPVEAEDSAQFAACVAELKAMGVDFTEAKPIDDGGGCGIDRPLSVTSLGKGIALVPAGTMRCKAAINLARWTREAVVPMLAKSQPAEALAEVNQASTYVCRKRNGADTGKISEHAHGNAVDIAGFTFRSGKTFTIAPREEESTLNGAFQRSIASAACLYFSTVLDPGSDKAHETHLHLDVLRRKGGYRYCW
jgi:hypothetical protein